MRHRKAILGLTILILTAFVASGCTFLSLGPRVSEVKGVLKDPDGEPLANAKVQFGTTSVVTDENGAFALLNMKQGTYTVTVLVNDEPVYQDTVRLSKKVVDLDLEIKLVGNVSGTILRDGGLPLYMARVEIGDEIVFLDTTGSFEVAELPYGDYDFKVFVGNHEVYSEALTIDRLFTRKDLTVTVIDGIIFEETFEFGGGNDLPANWTVFSSGGVQRIDDSIAYNGNYSFMLHSDVTNASLGLRSPLIPAVPGKQYTASAMYYALEGKGSLYIEFWNASGTRLTNTAVQGQNLNTWEKLEVSLVAPADAVAVSTIVYIVSSNTGHHYWDDVQIIEH